MTQQPYSKINGKRAGELVSLLQGWYQSNHRDLVWRRTRDPYSIWISEVMAQQTRITAVLPYYERFMERFPTLQALARAASDDVLKAWEGLGYYSRAHNLHAAAQIVLTQYDGIFPVNPTLLEKLPGVGAYTAGAIASICFDLPAPAVDGNVLRVFARLENNEQDIALAPTKKSLTAFLRTLIPSPGAGIFNQALMELGALVCLPQNPLCGECPAACLCKANALDRQAQLPVKSAKKEPRPVQKTVLIVTNPHGDILMRQRDERLLKGLWEFYMLDQAASEEEAAAHLRALGYTVRQVDRIGQATHTFTHMKWLMNGYHCPVDESFEPEGLAFAPANDLQELAMPTAIRYFREWALRVIHPKPL